MKVRFISDEEVTLTDEFVCVIDVISAFSTSAALFRNRAKEIIIAGDQESALALKDFQPNIRLIGEKNGKEIPGFDYVNDCTDFESEAFDNITCVLVTTSGTKCLIRNSHASDLVAASFCNAEATASYVKFRNPQSVTFVISNNFRSAEDIACAAYICELIQGNNKASCDPYTEIIRNSLYGRRLSAGEFGYVSQANQHDFVMVCKQQGELLVMTALNGSEWIKNDGPSS